jgi:hypothetical protein
MNHFKRWFIAFFAAVFVFGIIACEKEGPMEKAGKKADQAIEKTEEAVEDAAKAVKKKTE